MINYKKFRAITLVNRKKFVIDIFLTVIILRNKTTSNFS